MRTVPGLAVGLGGVPMLPEGKCRGCRQGSEKGPLFAERDTEVGPENLPSAPPVEVFQDHPGPGALASLLAPRTVMVG